MASIIIPKDQRETYASNILGLDREKVKKEKLKHALTEPDKYIDAATKQLELMVTNPVKEVFNTVYTMLTDGDDSKGIPGEQFPEDEARARAIQIITPYKDALMELFKELYPDSYQELAVAQQVRKKAAESGLSGITI